ncbi:SDR family oxidoreductase [bacterium]|nr:SDR family oxidoreductase [bacterium]
MRAAGRPSRVVVVTGAGSGIGLAATRMLAGAGYRVAAVVRKNDDAIALAAIENVTPFLADLALADQVDRLVREIRERMGDPNVLVNNAGFGARSAIEETPPATIREMFEVNTFAAIALVQAFCPAMRAAGEGLIVNVSSVTGVLSSPFGGIYAATKHAMEAWSDALRMELSPFGVRVVLIEPGPVATRFFKTARHHSEPVLMNPGSPYGAAYSKTLDMIANINKDAVTPESIARLILDLVNGRRPRARYRRHLLSRIAPFLVFLMPRAILDRVLQKSVGLR